MNLLFFNGSPRGPRSNTAKILTFFQRVLKASGENQWSTYYLNRNDQKEKRLQAIRSATHIILAFPLYTDAMPAIVKHFIEELNSQPDCLQDKRLGFIVQSGFPEPSHLRAVEAYLIRLCDRLNAHYMGTAVRGAAELRRSIIGFILDFQLKHEFYRLAYSLAKNGRYFTEESLISIAPRQPITGWRKKIMVFSWVYIFGFFYWGLLLIKNKAWQQQKAQPDLIINQNKEDQKCQINQQLSKD